MNKTEWPNPVLLFSNVPLGKVDTRKLHAKSTITGKIYQNNIIAENDTILSTNPFIPPAITILHQRYTDVSFRLNICAKSPFACFFI